MMTQASIKGSLGCPELGVVKVTEGLHPDSRRRISLHIEFANGWTLSIQVNTERHPELGGIGTYSAAYRNVTAIEVFSHVECAVLVTGKWSGCCIPKPMLKFFHCDTVLCWVDTGQLHKILWAVSSLPKATGDEMYAYPRLDNNNSDDCDTDE